MRAGAETGFQLHRVPHPSILTTRVSPSHPVSRISYPVSPLELDFDVHTRRQVEAHEGIDRLRAGVQDVDGALVRPHLEVLHRLLVDRGPADDAVDVLLRR